jgi:CheY-like chemotaxis protein
VVKGFIEMHGGLVNAHSAGLGHGSTFEIHLPLLDYSNDMTTEIEEFKVAPRRILVVDDHAKVADSLAALLTLVGHTTEIAYTSAQALERVASFNPEVVLLDLGLPEMDGYELAGRLRHTPQCATARLIALNGYGTAEDRQRSREAGFDDHLVKPADLDTLQRAIAGTRTS